MGGAVAVAAGADAGAGAAEEEGLAGVTASSILSVSLKLSLDVERVVRLLLVLATLLMDADESLRVRPRGGVDTDVVGLGATLLGIDPVRTSWPVSISVENR